MSSSLTIAKPMVAKKRVAVGYVPLGHGFPTMANERPPMIRRLPQESAK